MKLHGSMPSHLPFIFTEEDFRTYPERFSPFVNLAQQTLLENELCLIGFSGEDPNFLKWAGWVRDKLGTSARPIRLIGVLNLSSSRRKLFETRNITPIDLSPLVSSFPQADRHRKAMEILLEYLWQARPSGTVEWKRRANEEYALEGAKSPQERVDRLSEIWRTDREAYPGWLSAPFYVRDRARRDSQEHFSVLAKDLSAVTAVTRAAALFEAAWRFGVMYWSLPPWLEELAVNATTAEEDVSLPASQRVILHASLLKVARERRDWPQFDARAARLLSIPDEDVRAVHAYERCLRARDELDYPHILANAKHVAGNDPVWGLRRAALLAEILEEENAALLVLETHREIRRRRAQDRRSLWLLSREAWATYLMKGAWFELPDDNRSEYPEEWPQTYKAADTDPWDEFHAISDSIATAEKQARDDEREITPLFDPGHYQTRSGGTRWVNGAASSAHEQISYLADQVGLPLSLGADLIGQRWSRAVAADGSVWSALRSVTGHDYDLLERRFSRLAVARMSQLDVEAMIERLMPAITFGATQMARKGERIGDWAGRLSRLCDILSRLCVRVSGDTAIECFRLGASLLADPHIRHWWLLKGITNLLKRSLEALEPERRQEVALEVLRLPLPSEAPFGGIERDFPDASALLDPDVWRAREDNYAWNSRIAHLIDQVRGTATDGRQHAILRLLRLYEGGALTDVEATSFGDAIWSQLTKEGSPANTDLLPHVFMRLPSPDPQAPRKVIQSVVDEINAGSRDPNVLMSLHGASYRLDSTYAPYELAPEFAESLLSALLKWQPKEESRKSPFSPDVRYENEREELAIARVTASTILPSVPETSLTGEVVDLMFARIMDGSMPSLVQALPALMQAKVSEQERCFRTIRSSLLGGQPRAVQGALNALYLLERNWPVIPIPAALVAEVVSLCVMRREPGLVSALRVIAQLVRAGVVPPAERERLTESLGVIRGETRYDEWRDRSPQSDVGLIRRSAVQLANALKDKGEEAAEVEAWLSEMSTDPMPEVRYALTEADD